MRMRWPIAFVIVISSLLFGYELGQRSPKRARLLSFGGPNAPAAILSNGAPPTCDDSRVRAAVRAELAEFFAHAPPTVASGSPGAATEPTPDQEQASREALQLLEQRVAQGIWYAADVKHMRRLLDDVTDAQRAAITHQVILAIDSGSIKPGAGVFRPF